MRGTGWTSEQARHRTRLLLVSPRAWLASVALVFGVVQVLLVADVPLGWDESIYASQTDPRRPALVFSAPRARGMSWVAAPLQAVTGSPIALRVYLAVLASLALYAAYAVWLRLRPDGSVPLAAAAFWTLWLTVFYGPSMMPNVGVALAGVFATGTLLCAARESGPRWLPWAGGAAVAAATLVRPGDVVPLVGALGVAVLGVRAWRARAVALMTPPVVGAAVGALPWLVEAQWRYGGVPARVYRALSTQGTGERFVPDYQLRALDGPLLCRPCDRATQPIPLWGVLFWAGVVALVAVAVWVVVRRRRQVPAEATLLPAFVGGVMALPYLFLVGYAAPRFMLPAYALLALPVGQAVHHLTTDVRGRLRPVPVALVTALLLAHVVVQYRTLETIVAAQAASRAQWAEVSAVLARHGVVPPCTLLGGQAPPVAYVARCDAVALAGHAGDEAFSPADLRAVIRREPVAVVLRSAESRPVWAATWAQVPAGELPGGWRILLGPPPG